MISLRLALSIATTIFGIYFIYHAARSPSNRLLNSLFGFGFLLSGGSDLVAPDGSTLELWIDGIGTLFLAGAAVKLFFFMPPEAFGPKKS